MLTSVVILSCMVHILASPPPLRSLSLSLSRLQNRTKAYRVLRARLMDRKLQAEMDARRSVRRGQVKGADRSEKIRTYNFPQVSQSRGRRGKGNGQDGGNDASNVGGPKDPRAELTVRFVNACHLSALSTLDVSSTSPLAVLCRFPPCPPAPLHHAGPHHGPPHPVDRVGARRRDARRRDARPDQPRVGDSRGAGRARRPPDGGRPTRRVIGGGRDY